MADDIVFRGDDGVHERARTSGAGMDAYTG